MNPFGELSEDNHDQIRKYLRFFRQKRDGMLRSIAHEFADAKADRLNDDMFSKDDVEELLDFLESAVKVCKRDIAFNLCAKNKYYLEIASNRSRCQFSYQHGGFVSQSTS